MAILLIGIFSNVDGKTNLELQANDNVIIYALPYDFDEYSVYTADSYATKQWNSAVYAGLVKRSSANNRDWIPDLAASMPTISSNGRTFTFTLKADLKFSRGNILNTSDVKFSFHAALTPRVNSAFYAPFPGFLDNSSVNIIDELNIEFTLTQNFAFPFSLLSFPIVDEEVFRDRYDRCLQGILEDCSWNDPRGSDVVSAGPFMVSDIDNVNEIVTVAANPFYHSFDSVWADKIIFQKIAEKDAAISALAGGLIDILDVQYSPGLTELSSLVDVSEEFVGNPSHEEISLNHLHGYFGTGLLTPVGSVDPTAADTAALNVRKAMSHVVDRKFAVDEIMEGLGLPSSSTMPAASIGWNSALVPRNFSVDVAMNYMEMAGFDYKDAGSQDTFGVWSAPFFEITVLSPNSHPGRNQWAANYVLELPKIGIGVKEHVSTGWDEIIPRTSGYTDGLPPVYAEGGFDILFSGLEWDLDWNPKGFYDSSGRCDIGDCSNFYNFDIDETKTELADLITSYLIELNFDARITKAKDVQAELYKWVPAIPILYPISHWGFAGDLNGIDPLLFSVNALEWELVRKDGLSIDPILTTTITEPVTTTVNSFDTSSEDTTSSNEDTISSNEDTPTVILALSTIYIILAFGIVTIVIRNKLRKII